MTPHGCACNLCRVDDTSRQERGTEVNKPEEYRAKAERCLREAENAPESLRLHLISIAQHWYELAEHAERLRKDAPDKPQDKA